VKVETQFDATTAVPGAEVPVLLHLEAQAGSQPHRILQAPRLTVHLKPSVRLLRLGGDDGPAVRERRWMGIDLDDLVAGERHALPMTFRVPERAAAGLLRLATVELRYVELPALTRHLLTVPLAVDVVAP
jgi:Ca-activated chloride channel family protein